VRDYFQSLIDCLEDGVIIIDRERHIIQCNTAVQERLIGPPLRACAGQLCYEALPCHSQPDDQPDERCPVLRVLTTAQPVRETFACKERGETTWYDVLATPLKSESGEVVQVIEIWRDISELKSVQAQAQRRLQELSDLHLTGLASTRTLSLDKMLNNTLDLILEILHADAGGVYLIGQHHGERLLRLRAYRSLDWEVAHDIDYLKIGEGFSGRVIQSGEPLIVEDMRSDPRLTRRLLNRENIRAALVVPLQSDRGLIGTIWVAMKQSGNLFGEKERDWLLAASAQLTLAIENARLYEEVRTREAERARLLAHVIHAQEEERKRVARELHDETNQALTALTFNVESLLAQSPADENALRVQLARFKIHIGQIIDNLQHIILDLRPGPLDDLGLIPALKWHTRSRLEPVGIDITFDMTDRLPDLTDEQEIILFRVMQEAINNVIQHAEASEVSLSLDYVPPDIVITLSDDGRGFNIDDTLNPKNGHLGLGLLGIRERLALIGGQLEIQSTPHKGTKLRVTIPLTQEVR